jgi:hypothetical protein
MYELVCTVMSIGSGVNGVFAWGQLPSHAAPNARGKWIGVNNFESSRDARGQTFRAWIELFYDTLVSTVDSGYLQVDD